ncbi:small hydrophilic protein [Streptomyces sp. NPDC047981]|uniref:small hydrophilic protein n=1 Tax=Streptomyces sp. NPDC047981 TaxID=3154610 RepID=UPI003437ABC1
MSFTHRLATLAAVVAIPLGIAATSYALTDEPEAPRVPPAVELSTAPSAPAPTPAPPTSMPPSGGTASSTPPPSDAVVPGPSATGDDDDDLRDEG